MAGQASDGPQPINPGPRGPGGPQRRAPRLEESALAAALGDRIIAHWRRRGQWDKLKCAELLLVRGFGNKEAAARLEHLSSRRWRTTSRS